MYLKSTDVQRRKEIYQEHDQREGRTVEWGMKRELGDRKRKGKGRERKKNKRERERTATGHEDIQYVMHCIIPCISLSLYSLNTRYSCQYFHCIPSSNGSPHHLEWPGPIQPSPCFLSDMHPIILNLSSTLYTPYHFCSLHPKCPFAPSGFHALCFFPSIHLVSIQMLPPLSPSPQLP